MNKTTEQHQKEILDKTLFELPCTYVSDHTYESIPEQVASYVKENQSLQNELDALENELNAIETKIEEFYKYYAGFGAKKDLTISQMLDHILKNVPNYKPTIEDHQKEIKALQATINGDGHNIKRLSEENEKFRNAFKEIAKKNRKAETCRMIALKALDRLNDNYQPELLIEENLALKMKVEDLESQIISSTLKKVFTAEDHPLMHCKDCGEYWGYHHEEHCKGKLLDNADKHNKMYP